MKANKENLYTILLTRDCYFQIPVYQRNYSWKKENCEQLFEDIMKIYNGERKGHFVGFVVVSDEGVGFVEKKYSIIDGQQRITTFFILFKALETYYKDNGVDDSNNLRDINDILFDSRERTKIKLKPIKSDDVSLKELIINNNKSKSSIYENYEYFLKLLNNVDDFNFERFLNAIKSLEIIWVRLENDDNAQIIFESINATGVNLSETDLIRNFLLMGEYYNKQEELFEEYWSNFEKYLGIDKLNVFFHYFINYKHSLGKMTKKDEVYDYFKRYYYDNKFSELDKLELFRELDKYIKYYHLFINFENLTNMEISEKIISEIKEINKLNNDVVYVFLFNVFERLENKSITEEDAINTLILIKNYLVRRILLGRSIKSLGNFSTSLGKKIAVMQKEVNCSYYDAFKYFLVNQNQNTNMVMPTNEMFLRELEYSNFYRTHLARYALLKLENYQSNTNIGGNLSIEHIMPQKLTGDWNITKEEHQDYLHTLGNLTLTGDNSSLSNKSFVDKKNLLMEYKHIKMNEEILEFEEFNINQIKLRTKRLGDLLAKIFKYDKLDYDNIVTIESIKSEYYKTVTLDNVLECSEDKDLKIDSIIIESENFFIFNNIDLLESVLKYCYENKKDIFKSEIFESEGFTREIGGIKHFIVTNHEKGKYLTRYKKLNEQIYFCDNYSTKYIVKIIKKIKEIASIEEIKVVYKPKKSIL